MATKAMGKDEDSGIIDSIVSEFPTYEQYLDSQITPTDLFYLEVVLLRREDNVM